jgi:hypothetical protein
MGKSWLCAANSSSAWHTELFGGAPDSVRCPRLADIEPTALGNQQSCTAINHQTVRWCTGLSGESSAMNSSVSGNDKGDVAIIHRTVRWANWASGQRSSARSTRDTWPAPTVGWMHQTVRCAPDSVQCANQPTGATVGCTQYGRRSRTGQLQGLSGGAPDCPVHHSTEGKKCLPKWSSTAPSCLGAIKGTPRRMEHDTKYSLSILRHPDFAPTHLIHCVCDLSSIWVVNSLFCRLSLSLHLCAWLCCAFESCVCCYPSLLLCFFCDHHCKGERLQIVEIPRKREKGYKEESRGIQVDHWITWKGLSATLIHWDATTWK